MIVKTQYWLEIFGKDHAKRARLAAGKWLCYGPPADLYRYRERINVLVENGDFLAAKIAIKDPLNDPFPDRPGVLCVFTSADKAEIARTADRLRDLGLTPQRWKSEGETREDWSENGRMLDAFKKGKGNLVAAMPVESSATRHEKPPSPTTARPRWDIFLSKSSKDLDHARRVYDFLIAHDFRVFLSEVSLREIGKADYQAAIDIGLEESSHLVLVASSRQNLESPWVMAEWRSFLNEVRSGRKSGNLMTVLAGTLTIEQLPVSLRSLQVLPLTEQGMADLVHYLGT